MKSDNSPRHWYVEMVRRHRSELLEEWQHIETEKLLIRSKYAGLFKSSESGPLVKIYLWFSLRFELYQFDAGQCQRLIELRNEQLRELHYLKTTLHSIDF